MDDGTWPEKLKKLEMPFPEMEVQWRPLRKVRDREGCWRAKMAAYVDARAVRFRLDSVAPGAWSFEIQRIETNEQLKNAIVWGRVTIDGIARDDVGEAHWRKDDETNGSVQHVWKSAVSDCLKRCAVQFGVGAYLYKLGAPWVAWDPKGHVPMQDIRMPAWALPSSEAEVFDGLMIGPGPESQPETEQALRDDAPPGDKAPENGGGVTALQTGGNGGYGAGSLYTPLGQIGPADASYDNGWGEDSESVQTFQARVGGLGLDPRKALQILSQQVGRAIEHLGQYPGAMGEALNVLAQAKTRAKQDKGVAAVLGI